MTESDPAAAQAEVPKSGSPEGKGKSQHSTKTLRAAVAPLLGLSHNSAVFESGGMTGRAASAKARRSADFSPPRVRVE
jgi:hypothetical protein